MVADTAYSHKRNTLTTGALRVSIIDSTKLPDGTFASVWQTVWPPEVSPASPPWNVDTAYVWTSGDTVKISSGVEPILYPPKSMHDIVVTDIYISPLQTGKTWHLNAKSSRVVSGDTLSVPADTFNKVYQIRSGEGTPNYYLSQDEWFKSGVGLVQKMVSFNGTYYTWKLVDHHIK